MNTQFEAIFFDLDGTLRLTNPSPTEAFINLARAYDIEITPADEKRIKLWAHHYWGHEELVQQDMERLSPEDFWLHYSKLLLQTANVTGQNEKRAQEIRDWFGNEYQPEVLLAEGAKETLLSLKEMGFIVGLVSNRSHPLHEQVQELELDGIFDLVLSAGEVGYWKPNRRIFDHALAQFPGLAAGKCVYVGDNYYADGHGAEQAGLVPVIFDPEDLYGKSSFWRIQEIPELLSLVGKNEKVI